MVLEPWTPDPASNVLTAAWLPDFLDKIEAGLGDGEFYTTSTSGPRDRRADALLEEFKVPKRQSKGAIKLLVKVGILGTILKRSLTARREVEVYIVKAREARQVNEGDLLGGIL
jgi:hypothetical protein